MSFFAQILTLLGTHAGLQAMCGAYIGLILGGFLTVVWHRLPSWPVGARSVGGLTAHLSRPGSHCPSCGRALAWFDIVPLVGFLLALGRCRGCRTPIPWRYPLIELTTAVGFLLPLVPLLGTPAFWPAAGLAFLAVTTAAAWWRRPRAGAGD